MKFSQHLEFCVVDSNGKDYEGTCYASCHIVKEDGDYYCDDLEIRDIKLTGDAEPIACDSLATMPDQFEQALVNDIEHELGELLMERSGVLGGLSDACTPIIYSKRLEEQRLALPINHPDLPY